MVCVIVKDCRLVGEKVNNSNKNFSKRQKALTDYSPIYLTNGRKWETTVDWNFSTKNHKLKQNV